MGHDLAPVLELRQVSRSFGPIEVLHGVDIALQPGRVHALIGENGAGKSTMMKIMAGYQPPSSGQVALDGKPIAFASIGEAEARGISLIHQEFNLAEQLTVEENIFLGRELHRGPFLDKPAMRARVRELLAALDCRVPPERRVAQLSNSDKQMVEIAKALLRDTRVLIMDEPTAVLTRAETAVLLRQVRALRAAGTAVLFTSHKLDEVAEIADDLTIMRDGAVVWTGLAAGMDEHGMATAMVGREMSDLFPPKDSTPGEIALEVTGLNVPGHARDIGLTLRRGEVLGVAGLIGSGRTETFEALCGLRPGSGRVRLFGREVRINHPWQAQALGMCYLTEDRKTRGLLLQKGMRENLTLQALAKFDRGLIDTRAEDRALDQAIADFDIRGHRGALVGNLSGGNQQKLLFAKTLLADPEIIIIDEPTRGIDIGTKQQMYGFIRRLAAQGRAIVVISSEMQEVIGLADRVLVMRHGRITGELAGSDATEEAIVRLAMGVAVSAPQQESAT
ncbi:ribose transport system ATP-binding protein [Paracoccus halophilus]|uniref:ABC transporter ATP-binding protein n=1 Tax=Paracoccus halophilus TaxID=376733 RepID=A0A099F4F1_9RHOB|nr:sugar ABC transporter ATP-binding protein [Paracoccus halophilus]KGJ05605.1 ABC transporter ATP-binding protein [Paracoccus halophilus]SFA47354.1 ribose transport system ATP-binding protein [Paracoccus halophilus]